MFCLFNMFSQQQIHSFPESEDERGGKLFGRRMSQAMFLIRIRIV
jgi:hypothetical protein